MSGCDDLEIWRFENVQMEDMRMCRCANEWMGGWDDLEIWRFGDLKMQESFASLRINS